jgi:hypothetical protein
MNSERHSKFPHSTLVGNIYRPGIVLIQLSIFKYVWVGINGSPLIQNRRADVHGFTQHLSTNTNRPQARLLVRRQANSVSSFMIRFAKSKTHFVM